MDLDGNMDGKKGLGKKNGMSGGGDEKGCVVSGIRSPGGRDEAEKVS